LSNPNHETVITSNKKTIINSILKDEIEKKKNSIKKRTQKNPSQCG
jgi:hypothetical protein